MPHATHSNPHRAGGAATPFPSRFRPWEAFRSRPICLQLPSPKGRHLKPFTIADVRSISLRVSFASDMVSMSVPTKFGRRLPEGEE